MLNQIMKFVKEEDGATAIEYGLLAALISVVMIPAIIIVGNNLLATFNSVGASLS
jgi:pilus assembly protein Flp/PilA